jgi:hypothetical protein
MKAPALLVVALAACGPKQTGTPAPDPKAPRTTVQVCEPKQPCGDAPDGGSFPRGTTFVVTATWPDQNPFGAAVTCTGTVRCDVSAPRAEDGSLVFDVTTTTAGTVTMSVEITGGGGATKTIELAPYTIY